MKIATNMSFGQPAQRGSDGLPAAAVDPASGTIYAAWDDGRYRTDGTNDAVISRSFDNGVHWTLAPASQPGLHDRSRRPLRTGRRCGRRRHSARRVPATRRVGPRAAVHTTPVIDTYYQESFDGGGMWTTPLKVNKVASNPWYGAFSRNGTFEGDYYQVASAGGYTYIVRCQGAPAYKGEPAPLIANPNGSNTLVLTEAGKGHQHQTTWVALVRNR